MRTILIVFTLVSLTLFGTVTPSHAQTTKYVRYSTEGRTVWGVLEGEAIRELSGNVFDAPKPTGRTVKLADVRLLAPVEPTKVIAAGLNYRSHIGEQPKAKNPGLFLKLPTSIIGTNQEIAWHEGTTDLHFEGELVIVMGKKASRISPAEVRAHVFGVTAGNDVSERRWQKEDLQWLRAKGADTYGPVGPVLVKGLDYNNLQLTTRLNGEVVQSERTSMLLFNVDTIISHISQYITLLPGDIVFTGTPGQTRGMKPGDRIEVEIEGVGVLRNTIGAPRK